jgi:two-component system nitrate/nitrite response regulator NarL
MRRGSDRTNGHMALRSNSQVHETEPLRLVVITRYELIAAGIDSLLRAGGHCVLAHFTHGDDLLHALESNQPHALLLNVAAGEAVKLIARLRANHCSVAIILMLEERDVITVASLLELDVEGILLGATGATSLLNCVESVRQGRRWVDPDLLQHLASAEGTARLAKKLTQREADIANLVSRGLHNKQIARELHLSEGTVKMHLHHIYEKLQLNGRTELALSVAGTAGAART